MRGALPVLLRKQGVFVAVEVRALRKPTDLPYLYSTTLSERKEKSREESKGLLEYRAQSSRSQSVLQL